MFSANNLSKLLLTAALAPAAFSTAHACTCGAGRLAQNAGTGAGFTSGTFAGVQYDYANADRMNVDKDEVNNRYGSYIHTHRATLTVGYAFTGNFSVIVAPQYVNREFKRTPVTMMGMPMPTERGTENGFGDTLIALTANRSMRHDNGMVSVAALLGVETPTGDSDQLAAPGGMSIHMSGVHNSMLTLGSGSWDPVVGVSVSGNYARVVSAATLRYQFNTEGRADFRFGNATTWDLEGGLRVYGEPGATTVTLLAGATGMHLIDNERAGVRADGTAGDHIYAGPRVRVGVGTALSFNAGVGLPVYVRTDDGGMGGPHIMDSWNANFGMTYAF